ncbi:MAG: drug/metabolite transporter (DMT)-like permease [Cyclobacteriaceae bacterium]|jgi:drug/metabolite transporter (DMT)-like permease
MSEKTTVKAWVLLFALSLIWGSSFILIKRGLVGLSPMEVGALRILSAGIVMLPFAIRRFNRIPLASLKYVVIVGLAGSLIPSFLFAFAQTRIPSSLTGVLNAVTPIFTILISVFIYNQKKSPKIFFGIILGFIGTSILMTSGSTSSLSGFNAYALLILAATILYAVNGNVIKFHLSGVSSVTIASVSLVVGGFMSGIYLLVFTEFFTSIWVSNDVVQASGYIVLLGILGTAVALIIFNNLVSLTDPVFTSSVTYIIPVIAILWGIWDGETLNASHFIGIFMILLGVYITNRLSRVK